MYIYIYILIRTVYIYIPVCIINLYIHNLLNPTCIDVSVFSDHCSFVIRSFCHAAPVAARSSVVARVEKLSPSLWCRQLAEKLASGWSKPTGDIPLNPGWLIAILKINCLLQSLHNWVVKSTLHRTQPDYLHYSLFSKRDVGNGFRDVPHEYDKVWCKICKGVVPQFL